MPKLERSLSDEGEPGLGWFRENQDLAQSDIELKDNGKYSGVFRGVAKLARDYDDGTFLEDIGVAPGQERHFTMQHLFPYDWMGANIEYTITIEARRVEPNSTTGK